jgi:hypothetical protein
MVALDAARPVRLLLQVTVSTDLAPAPKGISCPGFCPSAVINLSGLNLAGSMSPAGTAEKSAQHSTAQHSTAHQQHQQTSSKQANEYRTWPVQAPTQRFLAGESLWQPLQPELFRLTCFAFPTGIMRSQLPQWQQKCLGGRNLVVTQGKLTSGHTHDS